MKAFVQMTVKCDLGRVTVRTEPCSVSTAWSPVLQYSLMMLPLLNTQGRSSRTAGRPGQPLRPELLEGEGGGWSSLALTSGCFRLRLKPALQFVSWNQEGWKTSLCSVPPVGHAHSLLALANNTCVKPTFMELRERFMRLYRKKAHLHHYLQVDGMEESAFTEAVSSLSALIQEYSDLEATKSMPVPDVPRLSVAL